MNNIKEIQTIEEFRTLLDEIKSPFYIFKHSTVCPTSSQAHRNVGVFIKNNQFPVYQVLVIESRPLSQYIAEHFSITHQSPQILLISNQKCVWHASHLAINETVMKEKIASLAY